MDYCSILKLSCFVNWDYPVEPRRLFQRGKAPHPLLQLSAVSLIAGTATFKGSFFEFSYLKDISLH